VRHTLSAAAPGWLAGTPGPYRSTSDGGDGGGAPYGDGDGGGAAYGDGGGAAYGDGGAYVGAGAVSNDDCGGGASAVGCRGGGDVTGSCGTASACG
jgi:hypothetical protein